MHTPDTAERPVEPQKEPLVHETGVDSAVAGQYAPITHDTPALEAEGQYLPTGHTPVAAASPVELQKNPAAQGVNDDAPEGQKAPAAHTICVPLDEPAGQ